MYAGKNEWIKNLFLYGLPGITIFGMIVTFLIGLVFDNTDEKPEKVKVETTVIENKDSLESK
jgi:hypothetical protein